MLAPNPVSARPGRRNQRVIEIRERPQDHKVPAERQTKTSPTKGGMSVAHRNRNAPKYRSARATSTRAGRPNRENPRETLPIKTPISGDASIPPESSSPDAVTSSREFRRGKAPASTQAATTPFPKQTREGRVLLDSSSTQQAIAAVRPHKPTAYLKRPPGKCNRCSPAPSRFMLNGWTRREALCAIGAALFAAARPSAQAGSLEFEGSTTSSSTSRRLSARGTFSPRCSATPCSGTPRPRRTISRLARRIWRSSGHAPRVARSPRIMSRSPSETSTWRMCTPFSMDAASRTATTPAAGIPPSWMPTASGFSCHRKTAGASSGRRHLHPTAVAVREEPVFRPTGIEHVLLNVADPEASARFYEKIFGPVTLRATTESGSGWAAHAWVCSRHLKGSGPA